MSKSTIWKILTVLAGLSALLELALGDVDGALARWAFAMCCYILTRLEGGEA